MSTAVTDFQQLLKDSSARYGKLEPELAEVKARFKDEDSKDSLTPSTSKNIWKYMKMQFTLNVYTHFLMQNIRYLLKIKVGET